MLLRAIGVLALLALNGSYVFSLHRSGAIQSWLNPTQGTSKPIVFDNGSVRDQLYAPAASQPKQTAVLSPPGALRKCVRGDRVTYSNLTCPAGFREQAVSAEPVTVVPAIKPPKSETTANAGGKHKALQEALDLKRDEQLRQRMIQSAIDAEAR
jgi:hypothetical protein